MGKLYYDNPLAAAYMAKEFGVRFPRRDGRGDYKLSSILCGETHNYEKPAAYSVHPDSYPIFEPQEGDNLRYDGDLFYIIARNGKPFFVPKTEE